MAGFDFFSSLGDFITALPAATLQIIGSPVTVGAEIAERAGICSDCAGTWTTVLDSLGAWSVEYASNALREYATNPRTWITLALVAATCIGTAGAGCVATATAAITQASIDLSENVARDVKARAQREVEQRLMDLPNQLQDAGRAEGQRIINAAEEEAKAKTRAAAGDLLYALAPRALLDLLERGGADADRVVSQSVGPLKALADRLAPLAGPEAAATIQEARVAARGAIMTAVRASIRTGTPVETSVRAALEPTLATYAQRIRTAALEGAARATADLGAVLTGLSLAWDPRQVRGELVRIYETTASPGSPSRVAATAPIWSVALTARDLDRARPAIFTAVREVRRDAIAAAPPLAAIRSALRARDRISPDKPYPYADSAIRSYIDGHAAEVRPQMLNGNNNSAAAIAAALAPGMAAAFGVRPPAPVAAPGPAAVQVLEAQRNDFAQQLANRSAAATQRAAAQSTSKPWGTIAVGVGVALAIGYAATR